MIAMVRWNGHGSGWKTDNRGERFRELRIYEDGGNVQVWAEVQVPSSDCTTEVLQYLEPWQAISVASGLIRSAMRAAWRGRR